MGIAKKGKKTEKNKPKFQVKQNFFCGKPVTPPAFPSREYYLIAARSPQQKIKGVGGGGGGGQLGVWCLWTQTTPP